MGWIVVEQSRWGVLTFLLAGLVACGGGDGGPSAPGATPPTATTELRVSQPLPSVVSGGDRSTFQVSALSSSGTIDVTNTVQVETDPPNRVQAALNGGWLTLTYANVPGPVSVTLRANGVSTSQSMTVNVSTLWLSVSDGYSGMTKAYGTDHYVSINGRELMLDVYRRPPGNQIDVSQQALVTSSDPSIVSVQAVVNPDGNIPWFNAVVRRPGTVDITARLGDITTTERIVIPEALVVEAQDAMAVDLTEGPAGRLTAFFIGSPNVSDLTAKRVAFSSSAANNVWGPLTLLQSPTTGPIPPSGLIPAGVKVGEGPGGHRAVVSNTYIGRVWVHLIGSDGSVRGPVDVADDLGEGSAPVAVVVAANGDAHVWLFKSGSGVRRVFVDAATLTSRTINTAPIPRS
jgi:hypothetical protein